MLIRARSLASLKAGRPSPLERPDNVRPDEDFFAQWHAWLLKALPKERGGWQQRIERKSLLPLPTCLTSLLLFDAMCAEVVQAMQLEDASGGVGAAGVGAAGVGAASDAEAPLPPFGEAMRAHMKLQARMPHATDES